MYEKQCDASGKIITSEHEKYVSSGTNLKSGSPGKHYNILLVESDKDTRNIITILLENEKYKVISGENNSEGIRLYRLSSPDLVMWNIKLMFENEEEIKNKICYIEQIDHIPFIALAEKPSYSEFRRVMGLGADDYICRPYHMSIITQTINRLIERYGNLKKRLEAPESVITKNEIDRNIVIRYRGKMVPISVNDILFVTVEKQYSKIFLHNNKHYVMKKSLSKWEQIIPEKYFIRIHRNTLVNINKVKEIKRVNNRICNVYLSDSDIILELTRNYYKNLNQYKVKR